MLSALPYRWTEYQLHTIAILQSCNVAPRSRSISFRPHQNPRDEYPWARAPLSTDSCAVPASPQFIALQKLHCISGLLACQISTMASMLAHRSAVLGPVAVSARLAPAARCAPLRARLRGDTGGGILRVQRLQVRQPALPKFEATITAMTPVSSRAAGLVAASKQRWTRLRDVRRHFSVEVRSLRCAGTPVAFLHDERTQSAADWVCCLASSRARPSDAAGRAAADLGATQASLG